MAIPHRGLAGEDMSLALKREENLGMQSSDTSEEEMRESGRTFPPPPNMKIFEEKMFTQVATQKNYL